MNLCITNSNSTQNNFIPLKKGKNKSGAFKGINIAKAHQLEAELASKGIYCNFRGDSFVGECTKKIVNVFEKLFGSSALPQRVIFRELRKDGYGAYNNIEDTVYINSYHSFFKDMQSLKAHAKTKKDEFSTTHPANIYVHEFAHAAHWHNLENTLGYEDAYDVWQRYSSKTVPTTLGKLITAFKLGSYSVKHNDMCEFVAEKATYDICNSLTSDTWETSKQVDVGYSDIFDRKHYKYENNPQAFIDRFMQYAWNGDDSKIEMANSMLGNTIENIRWGHYIKNRFF